MMIIFSLSILDFKFLFFLQHLSMFHSRRWFIFYSLGFQNFFFEVGVQWETSLGPSSLQSPHEELHPYSYEK
jgi:hypothetical protein